MSEVRYGIFAGLDLGQNTPGIREAAEKRPNCQGAREYNFISRDRENIVPRVSCEPIYKLLEPLEVALEMIRDEGKHPY